MGVSFYGELQSMDAHQDIQENMTHELAHESYLGRIGSVTCPGTSPFKLNTLNRYLYYQFGLPDMSEGNLGCEVDEKNLLSRPSWESPSFVFNVEELCHPRAHTYVWCSSGIAFTAGNRDQLLSLPSGLSISQCSVSFVAGEPRHEAIVLATYGPLLLNFEI